MKEEQELYDFIDQYLKDPSSIEGQVWPKGMDERAITEEIAYQRSIKNALLTHRLGTIKQTLNEVDQEAKAKTKFLKYVLTGLIVSGIIGAVCFWSGENKPKTTTPSQNAPKSSSKSIAPSHTAEQSAKPPTSKPLPQSREQSSEITVQELPEREEQDSKTQPVAPHEEIQDNVPLPKHETQEPAHNPCLGIQLQTQYTFQNPCLHEHNGSIHLEEAIGGKAPYLYSVDAGKNFQPLKSFEALSKGSYEIAVKDAEGCINKDLATVVLIETLCTSNTSPEQVFNPSQETWELQKKDLAGTLEIYNMKGLLVYRSNFGKFDPVKWNGHSIQGDLIAPGIYVYKILYEDSNVQQGSVTVVY